MHGSFERTNKPRDQKHFTTLVCLAVWNKAENLRFGFLNRTKTQKESVTLCKTSHFANLITVRSREELNELEEAIEDYDHETSSIEKASFFCITALYFLHLIVLFVLTIST